MLGSTARIEKLKRGDFQFGHAGRHHGNGTEECPRELHHHHDEFCDYPTDFELKEAGIDPLEYGEFGFQIRSRADHRGLTHLEWEGNNYGGDSKTEKNRVFPN